MLFGHGLFGNLAGFASVLGLLAQIGLVVAVGWLGWRWWRSRSQPQPAFAGMPGGAQPQAYDATPSPTSAAPAPLLNSNTGPRYGAGDDSFLRRAPQSGGSQYGQPGGRYEQEPGEPVDEIGIKPEDYDAFERLLGEIQTFYGKEDVGALRARVTPEMMGYLNEDLAENASRGVVAQLSNVKLLQGDLAEAWAEGNVEYATVALRYELIDTLVERDTQKVVEGDPAKPSEVTELWTFVRSRDGGKWMLSAIQNPDEEEEG
jgi:predicted lipid-binding transport protein (Tim44 family)